MASMTSPDHTNINCMGPADGDVDAAVGSFLNLPSAPALAQPHPTEAASAEQDDDSTGETSGDESEESGDDDEEQMDLMLAVLRLLQKEKPKKNKKAAAKSNARDAKNAGGDGGAAKGQKQLLTVLSKALGAIDGQDEEPAASAPKQKRAKLNGRKMPQLAARPCADSAAPAQQKPVAKGFGASGGGFGVEGGDDTILHCFMDQLPQIDGHLDAMIAAADAADAPQEDAQPADTEHVSSSAGGSPRDCSAQQHAQNNHLAGGAGSRPAPPHTPHFSASDRQNGSWDAVSSSSMDSSAVAAAAAAAAALAVSSRKRKSPDNEATGAVSAGNGQTNSSRSEDRWNGNAHTQAQGQGQGYAPLSLPQGVSCGPVVVSRQQLQQSACKPPLLSLPAACLAAPGAASSAHLLRNPLNNASAASAPPPPATPLRMLTVPADVSPPAMPMARPNVMERFDGAEQPLGFPVRFGSNRGDEGDGANVGNSHGYNHEMGANGGEEGNMGYDDMGGDDMDEWMPRSRGRKERQVAGGRIKARSMAERQRRERISEGLQKLRMVVRGHGDTATMLDNACAYVQALQRRVTSLETNMLLHQASCGGVVQSGEGATAGSGANMNNRGLRMSGFINPSQFGSLFSLDV